MNPRIFVGVFPAGISYADREREVGGDYKRLAFLSFDTLKLKFADDCPAVLEREIEDDARVIQCQVGQQYGTSATGQTVLLGKAVKPVRLKIIGPVGEWTYQIHAFSMRETSRMACTFKTVDGRVLTSDGCLLQYEGNIDDLPPAFC